MPSSSAKIRPPTRFTTNMPSAHKFGEVFICRFPFTSGEFSKPRPVLILFDLQRDVIICRITSAARRGSLDVDLRDWKEAGLAKPSIARLNRLVTAEKMILGRHLGILSEADKGEF